MSHGCGRSPSTVCLDSASTSCTGITAGGDVNDFKWLRAVGGRRPTMDQRRAALRRRPSRTRELPSPVPGSKELLYCPPAGAYGDRRAAEDVHRLVLLRRAHDARRREALDPVRRGPPGDPVQPHPRDPRRRGAGGVIIIIDLVDCFLRKQLAQTKEKRPACEEAV